MKIVSVIVAAALAVTATSATQAARVNERGEARLARITDGRVPGKPVDCLDLRRVSSTEVVDGTAIVYHVGNRLYVNRPHTGADSLRRDDVLLTRNHDTRLCSIDSVRLLDQGLRFQRGFVGLGKFVPYGKPAARG